MSELVKISNTCDPERRGDVIFVHGLNGDARSTWQLEGQPDRFWPAWICEDVPGVGVWSVGYPVSSFGWKGSTMPLADRAVNALVLLDAHGLGTEKPVVFMTHSLGGLLVKEMLRKATDGSVPEGKALAERTRGVVFLSTPHSGSDLANFMGYLKFLLPTVSIDELNTQEPRLRELNTWYRNNVQKLSIETQVYCERKPTPSGRNWMGQLVSAMVVDATSSDPGIAGVTAVPMDDDHISISRPERAGILYLRVKQFVERRLASESSRNQESSSPATHPPVAKPGVAIDGDVAGGVIVTGSGNVHDSTLSSPASKRKVSGEIVVDPAALRDLLDRLMPQQFDVLVFKLDVPGYVLPGRTAPHGDRVSALLEWARGPTGLGMTKVREELEKLLRPR